MYTSSLASLSTMCMKASEGLCLIICNKGIVVMEWREQVKKYGARSDQLDRNEVEGD